MKKEKKMFKWNDAKLSTLFDLHCILRGNLSFHHLEDITLLLIHDEPYNRSALHIFYAVY